jgi:iron complex outermembrane receptor protein
MEALGARISNAQPGGILGWFGTYLNSYFTHLPTLVNPNPVSALNTMLGGIMNNGITTFNGLMTALGNSGADIPSHIVARDAANANMLTPGSDAFKQALYTNSTTSISDGGGKIVTNSKANTIEFNYNLGDYIESFDLSIGGSFREYVLRSGGSLFSDYDSPIVFNETGVYVQAIKSLFNDGLKLTGSMRYDKSQFLDGNFTPRIGALINLSPKHNIRVSYQTGFRNPSSQDMYISLDVATAVLIGTSPDSVDRFKMNLIGQSSLTPYTVTGNMVQNNSYTLGILNGDFTPAQLDYVEPEFV